MNIYIKSHPLYVKFKLQQLLRSARQIIRPLLSVISPDKSKHQSTAHLSLNDYVFVKMTWYCQDYSWITTDLTFNSNRSIKISKIHYYTLHMFSLGGEGFSWSWSYGSWIYNYLCNQWISPLTLWVQIPLMYSIQYYVIKFVSHLRQVGGFLLVFRSPPPIKLTTTI